MDFKKLESILAPAFRSRGPAESWEQVERINRLALGFRTALGEEAVEVDSDLLNILSLLITLGAEVPRNLTLRGSIEAFLVQEGWTRLKVRQLMRALENLPHKPETIEEKLAADAFTMARAGMLGFARHIQRGATEGRSLGECMREMQKSLRERFYSRPAQVMANERRDELRQLIGKLQKALEA